MSLLLAGDGGSPPVIVLPKGTQWYEIQSSRVKERLDFEQQRQVFLSDPVDVLPIGQQVFDSRFIFPKQSLVFDVTNLLANVLSTIEELPKGRQEYDLVLPRSKKIEGFDQQNLLLNRVFVEDILPVGEQSLEFFYKTKKLDLSFEYQDKLNTLFSPGVIVAPNVYYDIQTGNIIYNLITPPLWGSPPRMYFDKDTGRFILLLLNTTTPKIVMSL